MVVNNQSSGTVNWSQGTAPLPEERLVVGQSGQLVSGGKTGNRNWGAAYSRPGSLTPLAEAAAG